MNTENEAPHGILLLRTLAMPANTNPSGDIFGGWIMSQMDMGGGLLAGEIAKSRVVTVAVESMSFIGPVKVGDVVCCYGECLKTGNTSIQIKVEVWVKKLLHDGISDRMKVTEAVITYVAVDAQGKSHPVHRPA